MIRLALFSLVAGAAIAGAAQAALPPVSFTYADQVLESRQQAIDYLAAGSPYGPIHGTGPDQYIVWHGQPLQLEYLACALDLEARALPIRWYEDGSVRCD